MNDEKKSKTLKGSGRTYFFDVDQTKQGKPYLKITESRKKPGETDKDKQWQRSSINVFPEDRADFHAAVLEMTAELKEEETEDEPEAEE